LCCPCSGSPAVPPSFPTRRSSDLTGLLLIASCTALVMRGLAGLADGIIARYPVDVVDNLQARRIHTQARVFSRLAQVVVFISGLDRKSTRLNSSHVKISYAVFCLK